MSKYSRKLKFKIVKYCIDGHHRVQTAIAFKWERIYYEKGPQVLYKERRGRSKNMSFKPRKKMKRI